MIQIIGVKKPISALGLGTMIFSPEKKEISFEILDSFVSKGGTLIDTAEVYGDPEEHGYSEITIGMWLEERKCRNDVAIVTKGCIPDTCKPIHPNGLDVTPEHIHAAIAGSLERLKTDYVDLWLLHRDDETKPVGPLVEALNKELSKGTIKAFGGSNWSTKRIEEANKFAEDRGLTGMSALSNHFCLANSKVPYWPKTVSVDDEDKEWHSNKQFPLLAWSSTGRGFFAKGDPEYLEDPNLVRVYYSDDNFEKLRRAEKLGQSKGLTRIEVAIAYVLSQDFPVVALVGVENDEQIQSCIKAMGAKLTKAEIGWLNLQTGTIE